MTILKLIFIFITNFFEFLLNSIKYLWKTKIKKINLFTIFILSTILFARIVYNFERLSTTYLYVFIFVMTVLLLTGLINYFLPPDNLKKQVDEYEIKIPKNIPVEKFIKQGEEKKLGAYLGCKIPIPWHQTFKNITPLYVSEQERLLHCQVVGSTGSGKTIAVLEPLIEDDIKNGRPLIFIDAKANLDNIKKISYLIRKHNREKDYNILSLSELERSFTYNPFEIGNSSQLTDKIIGAMDWAEYKETDSRHYISLCETALQNLFNDHEKHSKEKLTFSQVYKILQNPDRTLYPELAFFLKNHSKDISSLTAWLSRIIHSNFGFLFESPKGEINLLDAYQNNKIIYFALDTQSYEKIGKMLGKIIIKDLTTISGEIQNKEFLQNPDQKYMGIFIDECQSFITPSFTNFLEKARGSKFMLTISYSSIGNLDKIGIRSEILQGINTHIILKINDPQTAEVFSKMAGTYKAIEKTHQTIVDRIFSRLHSIMEKVVNKRIFPPEIFMKLKTFQAICIHKEESSFTVLNPNLENVENEPLPEKRQRKDQNKDDDSSKNPPPAKSVF
jgi:hypothetical protein